MGELFLEEPWGWGSPEAWRVLPQGEGQSLTSVPQQLGQNLGIPAVPSILMALNWLGQGLSGMYLLVASSPSLLLHRHHGCCWLLVP